HLVEAAAHDHLDIVGAEPARGAAAVHRGVAAAQHDHALADLVDMAERDVREPVDADVDVGLGLRAAGNIEVAAARRTAADENRVVAIAHQPLEAVDALAEAQLDAADARDVADLLVDHGLRQAEARNLAADHAAGLGIAIEDHEVIAKGREVPRDGKRGG